MHEERLAHHLRRRERARRAGLVVGGVRLAADASRLAEDWRAFVQEAGAAEAMNEALADAHAQELSRFGASELHAVASVVGGVASQEAVKVIARQYEPVDHTYVFNGIAGVGGVVAV